MSSLKPSLQTQLIIDRTCFIQATTTDTVSLLRVIYIQVHLHQEVARLKYYLQSCKLLWNLSYLMDVR